VSKSFVVVYEAPADFATATELADRVLMAEIGWIDETLLDSQRLWIGKDHEGSLLTWKSVPGRARDLEIRVRGHFNGEPGLPDARAARRAIAYVLSRFETVDAILLIRDMDDQSERREGLEQGRSVYSSATRIIIGLAVTERECWVISGFDPGDDDETKRLEDERQNLGFDPCECSHELTACKNDQAKRSPKRVLSVLTGGSGERQRRCWQEAPLPELERRGQGNGLSEYFKEIRSLLVPLITGHERKPG
jgi:hypothetical protein